MRQILLNKLQPATPAERRHGIIVVRKPPDGTYGVVTGKRCLKLLRELEQSALVPADIPIRCVVLGEEGQDSQPPRLTRAEIGN